jgi:hypothetical protein
VIDQSEVAQRFQAQLKAVKVFRSAYVSLFGALILFFLLQDRLPGKSGGVVWLLLILGLCASLLGVLIRYRCPVCKRFLGGPARFGFSVDVRIQECPNCGASLAKRV